jgi:hypothetical protein
MFLLKAREYPASKQRLFIADHTTSSGVCNEEIFRDHHFSGGFHVVERIRSR